METILKVLRGGDEDKNEKSFRILTFLLIQFLLVSVNLVFGFVTDSMSITACVGYHLAVIFLLGDDVAKVAFPNVKAAKIGRVAVLIFDSIMTLGFSVIIINEFFTRLDSPIFFSDASVWAMIAATMISTILSIIYVSQRSKRIKEMFVPAVVFVTMLLLKIFDFQQLDSYVGLWVSVFVIYLAVKMIIRAWRQRKNF